MEGVMDVLSDFVSRTNTDPSFAQDLLEATGWDLNAALTAFEGLNITREQHLLDDTGFSLSEYDEIDINDMEHSPPPPPPPPPLSSSTELSKQGVKKRSTKRRKARGLTGAAEEISDTFLRVAVSETKLKVGCDQKEKVFDEQFFKHSFLRPDFSRETDELQQFIVSDITETSHKHVLEKSGHLNWWASTGKLPTLEPLATSGDGNCLLHAASLYMWGLPDQNLILRTHLYRTLTDSVERDGIHRRWKHSTHVHNQEAGGLTFSEDEWEFEWHEIVRISTNQPRRRPTTDSLRRYSSLRPHFESLEEVHVFGLAHVLRRPVIVVADEFLRNMGGEPLAPIYFGGIYLPFECSSSSCFKSPLVLAYDSSHFSPLVAKKDQNVTERHKSSRFRHMQSKQDTVIPLVTPDGSLLPLLFPCDPKRKDFPEKWVHTRCPPGDFPDEIRTLLESYMDIRWIQLDIGAKFGSHNDVVEEGRMTIPVKIPKVRFPAAVISSLGEPEYQCLLVEKYLENVKKRFEEEKVRQEKVVTDRARQIEEMKRIEALRPVPCRGDDCQLFGTADTQYLCSLCYADTKYNTPPIRSVSVPAKQPRLPIVHSATPPELIIKSDQSDIADVIDTPTKDLSNKPLPPDPPVKVNPKPLPPDPPVKVNPKPLPPDPPVKVNPKPLPPDPHPRPHPLKQPPNIPPRPVSRPDIKPHSLPSRGYSRDNIKPLSLDSGSSDRIKCPTLNCKFHGGTETGGYCSTCYRQNQPKVTHL